MKLLDETKRRPEVRASAGYADEIRARCMPLKIVFVMRHPGYTRNFESVLRLLAERGHHVHLVLERQRPENPQSPSQMPLVARLCEQYPNLTVGSAAELVEDGWRLVARSARQAQDYLRYLRPPYREAQKLRQRAEGWSPRIVRRVVRWPLIRTPLGLAALSQLLRWLDQAAPPNHALEAFLHRHRPDLILVTPLIEPGSRQADYIRSAKRLGMRTGLLVHSWDNLSNKGLIHETPHIVTVWNGTQKQEAIGLHRVPAARVVVTGASAYDHWFDWSVSRDRETFCRRVGLRAERLFLLYLCSSPFIAPNEAAFVRQWIARVREHGDDMLRDVGVLIRPHPQNAAQWQNVDLSEPGQVAIWPRGGADPVNAEAKADYYDSIYHSAAVVGVNSSALIESAIVGRSVYSLLAPEFRDTQERTLHFHYLSRANGGLLHVASSLEDHLAQLTEALASHTDDDERKRRFVENFVRPHGLDVPAAPKVVSAIEELCAGETPQPRHRFGAARLLQAFLAPLACVAHRARQRSGAIGGKEAVRGHREMNAQSP
jgi:hypothetical protein